MVLIYKHLLLFVRRGQICLKKAHKVSQYILTTSLYGFYTYAKSAFFKVIHLLTLNLSISYRVYMAYVNFFHVKMYYRTYGYLPLSRCAVNPILNDILLKSKEYHPNALIFLPKTFDIMSSFTVILL